jgi:uncharacterized damage-inducible protein DinB
MDLLDRMLGHDHWATSQVLERSRDLTDAQLDQPFDIGLGSLRETLHHTIYVIYFWTTQMGGEQPPRRHEGHPSIAELGELHERFSATFAAFVRRACKEQRLDDTFIDHYNYPQTIGSTILQVMTHNQQHRNEARHILERLGVPDLWDYDPQEWEHVMGQLAGQTEQEER